MLPLKAILEAGDLFILWKCSIFLSSQSHKALAQLDKQSDDSDEQSLQRIKFVDTWPPLAVNLDGKDIE